jgi:Peptidase inhibitor I78 family
MIALLPLLLVISAGDGVSPRQEAEPPEFGAGTCKAGPAHALIGKRPTKAMIERARIRAAAKNVRIRKPGFAYTDDYRTDRLNINLDRLGKVVRVFCG